MNMSQTSKTKFPSLVQRPKCVTTCVLSQNSEINFEIQFLSYKSNISSTKDYV